MKYKIIIIVGSVILALLIVTNGYGLWTETLRIYGEITVVTENQDKPPKDSPKDKSAAAAKAVLENIHTTENQIPGTPDTAKSGAEEQPATVEPGTAGQEMIEPEPAEQGTIEPGTTQQETTEQNIAESGDAQQQTPKPEMEKQDTVGQETAEPEQGEPHVSQELVDASAGPDTEALQ